jgi:glycosyltransferase involved in cell wall biosynthesis
MSAMKRDATQLPLRGETVICLATQEWDAHWSVAQQVASRLVPANRVIYVEPFHPPFAWMRRQHRLLKTQRDSGVPRVREVRPGLTVYRPSGPYLPGNMRLPVIHLWNSRLYRRELLRMMRSLNIREPILWAFFAQTLSVGSLPVKLFVYDCVDDWPSFFSKPVERRWVERIDAGLTARADIVFTGSDPLAKKKSGKNSRIRVVNHGADIAHFMKAAAPETVEPPDIASLPHPRIGFVGMIDPLRFDPDLIARLAMNESHQIVIVGGFLDGAEKSIPARNNVHRLGMKHVGELPAYIKGFDVCIMPYRINETTRYIFPLKLFEYLATGKPVVATPIPAVELHRDYLHVADTPEAFARAVEMALHNDSSAESERRRRHALGGDWGAHVDKKARAIAEEFDLIAVKEEGDRVARR